jgi:CBS domain-containing protein
MLCLDVMKQDLAYVSHHDNVHKAARLMQKHGIGFLPVVDDDRKPLGALTDRDIVLRVCTDDHRPSNVSVRDAMTPELVVCRPLDDVRVAEDLMARRHVSRVMVVGDDGALVGVISLSDIALAEEDARVGSTLREVAAREAH